MKALADLCPPDRKICYGIVQPGRHAANGKPILRVKNLTGDRVDHSDVMRVDEAIEAKYRRSRIREGDVLVSLVGSLGQVAIAGPEVDGWNIARAVGLIPVSDRHHAEWIRYSIQSREAQSFIRDHANTTVQATFNLKDLARLPIPYPSERSRQEILSILGTLDDKIEVNRKTAATLEAMARALYRSWFVDFDPVHAKAEGRAPAHMDPATAALFPDRFGEDGLPEGWEMGTIAHIFDVVMGQSPPGSSYNEEGDGLPFFQGRTDFGFRFPARRKFCTQPSRIAPRDSILLSVRAPVGDLNRALEACCIGRGVASLSEKAGRNAYGYEAMQALSKELKSYDSEGTVFGSINKKQLSELELVLPPTSLASSFDVLVKPMDEKIRNITGENKTLATLRDTLLPRLMSGELRVGAAREQVEEAV